MDKIINVHDAKTHFSKYMARAASGENIRIGKNGKPMVRLVPDVQPPQQPRKPGILEGKIWIGDDFDEPMPELISAMEEDIDAHTS